MTTLEKEILEVLSNAPYGLKGREIAQKLHEDKTLINSTLYHNMRDKCRQDPDTYKWYLKETKKPVSKSKPKPKATVAKKKSCRSSSSYRYGSSSCCNGPKLYSSNIPSLNNATLPLGGSSKKTNTDAFDGRVMEFDRDGLLISIH